MQLDMTQIDSGLARGLDCVESQAVAWSGSGTQRGFFKRGTEVHPAGISRKTTKREECGHKLLPHSEPQN